MIFKYLKEQSNIHSIKIILYISVLFYKLSKVSNLFVWYWSVALSHIPKAVKQSYEWTTYILMYTVLLSCCAWQIKHIRCISDFWYPRHHVLNIEWGLQGHNLIINSGTFVFWGGNSHLSGVWKGRSS